MNEHPYFSLEDAHAYEPTAGATDRSSSDSFLDDLLHQKSQIFASKLEVLSAAMVVRVQLLRENVLRIDLHKERAENMLTKLDCQARYHLREHRDKGTFYQILFRLEEERRSQAVECWRDIVLVLRDFLGVWEAHEQSQARAIFLEHVGE